VSGNVAPKQVARLCALAQAGQHEEARELDKTLQPLNTMLFVESNPIPVKWAMSELGLMSPGIRLPLTAFSAEYHERMRAAIKTAGVCVEEAA
ncbi:MAG: dihydrodipicolinate synthase family protein, partial [Woeseiaceae bacterium]